jgi:hypothetical protein
LGVSGGAKMASPATAHVTVPLAFGVGDAEADPPATVIKPSGKTATVTAINVVRPFIVSPRSM